MKLSIISFGPNPLILAKFQTERLRTFGENGEQTKNKNTDCLGVKHTLAAAILRWEDAAGSIKHKMGTKCHFELCCLISKLYVKTVNSKTNYSAKCV